MPIDHKPEKKMKKIMSSTVINVIMDKSSQIDLFNYNTMVLMSRTLEM